MYRKEHGYVMFTVKCSNCSYSFAIIHIILGNCGVSLQMNDEQLEDKEAKKRQF